MHIKKMKMSMNMKMWLGYIILGVKNERTTGEREFDHLKLKNAIGKYKKWDRKRMQWGEVKEGEKTQRHTIC